MKGVFVMQNKPRLAIVAVLILAVLLTVLFSLRNVKQPVQTPTVNVNLVRTEAVATFAYGLTSTASVVPATLTSTSTPLSSTSTQVGTDANSPTPSCYRLKYVRDVTIPDNTPMTPAQVFTKTWLVENSGLCAWRPGFKLVLVGGEAMGGSPFNLVQSANPGDRIEVSVKMAAPTNLTGITQGTWRMTDENGNLFGDALTVVVDIGGSGTGVPSTPQSTNTPWAGFLIADLSKTSFDSLDRVFFELVVRCSSLINQTTLAILCITPDNEFISLLFGEWMSRGNSGYTYF
jgi:hypothetical protein